MTINVPSIRPLTAFASIALIAAACSTAFLVGQSTRITDATAAEQTRTSVASVRADEQRKASAALVAADRAADKRLDQRVHRVNNMWRKRLRKAADKARADGTAAGYSSGSAAGYSSGSAAGYSSGKSDGKAEGYSEGYGEGNLDGYFEGYDDGYYDW
jgi:flagellar biosynthesis/type III secretory pathway protein FliH